VKLYVLKWKGSVPYDGMGSCVVRAHNESEARDIAQNRAGDEARPRFASSLLSRWTNPDFATCEVITTKGEPQMICRDFRAG
jgi:hypothetical protein